MTVSVIQAVLQWAISGLEFPDSLSCFLRIVEVLVPHRVAKSAITPVIVNPARTSLACVRDSTAVPTQFLPQLSAK
jgi:hypothetical protein